MNFKVALSICFVKVSKSLKSGLLTKTFLTGRGRQRDRVMARDLFCYWSVVELGMSMIDLARRFDITSVALSCAVQRGETTLKERDYQLEI